MVELMAAGASLALAGAALAMGWQAGRRSGREEGKARAALELHRRALTGARCPACGRPVDDRRWSTPPDGRETTRSRHAGIGPRQHEDGEIHTVMTGLPFLKMHGLGNAYVFVDLMEGALSLPDEVDWPGLSRAVADPHFGIGSDGLILIAPGATEIAAMRIFNADGSEGEMCGNGIRCLAMWVHQAHGAPRRFPVETRAGLRQVEVVDSPAFGRATVRVDMGRPMEVGPAGKPLGEPLRFEVDGQRVEAWPVSVGNPHVVVFVDSVDEAPVRELGPRIERHPLFPQRTNVEFLEVAGPGKLRMRVWERGSGETMACGTGACASLVAAVAAGRAGRSAEVELPGGRLSVEWDAEGRIWMTGPAQLVAQGVLPWNWVKEVGSR